MKSLGTFSRESLKGAWSSWRSCRQGDKELLKDPPGMDRADCGLNITLAAAEARSP